MNETKRSQEQLNPDETDSDAPQIGSEVIAKRTDPSPPSCADRAASRRPPDLARNLLRKRRTGKEGQRARLALAGWPPPSGINPKANGQAHGIGSRSRRAVEAERTQTRRWAPPRVGRADRPEREDGGQGRRGPRETLTLAGDAGAQGRARAPSLSSSSSWFARALRGGGNRERGGPRTGGGVGSQLVSLCFVAMNLGPCLVGPIWVCQNLYSKVFFTIAFCLYL
jgi:hypothetical protein